MPRFDSGELGLDWRRGRHRKRDSPETHDWNRQQRDRAQQPPPRPPWLSDTAYRRLVLELWWGV